MPSDENDLATEEAIGRVISAAVSANEHAEQVHGEKFMARIGADHACALDLVGHLGEIEALLIDASHGVFHELATTQQEQLEAALQLCEETGLELVHLADEMTVQILQAAWMPYVTWLKIQKSIST